VTAPEGRWDYREGQEGRQPRGRLRLLRMLAAKSSDGRGEAQESRKTSRFDSIPDLTKKVSTRKAAGQFPRWLGPDGPGAVGSSCGGRLENHAD